MISTRRLDLLPDIDQLRRTCQSVAMLDAIVEPEWEYRYYSFDATWAPGEMLASMRDGSGDDYFILFAEVGAIIKGFAHESSMASYVEGGRPLWPGIVDQLPGEFARLLDEPAISIGTTSFCIWRRHGDSAWRIGDIAFPTPDLASIRDAPETVRDVVLSWEQDPDGSEDLLFMLDGKPETYRAWAEEYYGRTIPLNCVERIYRHEPLTAELVAGLNPDITIADLRRDIEGIGYPAAYVEER